jgi:hypothetical protein
MFTLPPGALIELPPKNGGFEPGAASTLAKTEQVHKAGRGAGPLVSLKSARSDLKRRLIAICRHWSGCGGLICPVSDQISAAYRDGVERGDQGRMRASAGWERYEAFAPPGSYLVLVKHSFRRSSSKRTCVSMASCNASVPLLDNSAEAFLSRFCFQSRIACLVAFWACDAALR